jgi:hypothetical protein
VIELELRFAVLRVTPDERLVDTVFPDGRIAHATRDDTPENRETAVDLGYTDSSAGVWRALVDHELLHSLLADWSTDRPSPVLRHCAGAERVPYLDRIAEECGVLAMQRYMNTGAQHPALMRFRAVDVRVWASNARRWLDQARAE